MTKTVSFSNPVRQDVDGEIDTDTAGNIRRLNEFYRLEQQANEAQIVLQKDEKFVLGFFQRAVLRALGVIIQLQVFAARP